MDEIEWEIICEPDQKNYKRKSYKQAREKLKSVSRSEEVDE